MTGAFRIDPRILSSTLPFGRLRLCTIRLMNDRRFPWLVLLPERPDLREIHELEAAAQALLMQEIGLASRALKEAAAAQKINVGALGNIVPQLHIHIVGRSESDAAWPGPVWGFGTAIPYRQTESDDFIGRLKACFSKPDPAPKAT